ncbi:hypothetical protein QBC46DRAFT_40144 [Diplogelasinospora grovesii]|uniref:Zn(2)-C6 fungal-type domain-containing protein n=1 Tax=Diplogelasinospora grovesii TaxID=303347 RepID=A0AAN6S7L7_9PEZI|nr:hypothetical protein QBC46DRAFT_40144 [Diplogelasinospora grovesii]
MARITKHMHRRSRTGLSAFFGYTACCRFCFVCHTSPDLQANVSNQGCYTCRLRRKKCDEGSPMCSACRMLVSLATAVSEGAWRWNAMVRRETWRRKGSGASGTLGFSSDYSAPGEDLQATRRRRSAPRRLTSSAAGLLTLAYVDRLLGVDASQLRAGTSSRSLAAVE